MQLPPVSDYIPHGGAIPAHPQFSHSDYIPHGGAILAQSNLPHSDYIAHDTQESANNIDYRMKEFSIHSSEDILDNQETYSGIRNGHGERVFSLASNGLPLPYDGAPDVPNKKGRTSISNAFSHEDSFQDMYHGDPAELSFQGDMSEGHADTSGMSVVSEPNSSPPKTTRATSEGSILSAQENEEEQRKKVRVRNSSGFLFLNYVFILCIYICLSSTNHSLNLLFASYNYKLITLKIFHLLL